MRKIVKKIRPHTSKITWLFLVILIVLSVVFLGVELSTDHVLTNTVVYTSSFGGWIVFLLGVHVITRR